MSRRLTTAEFVVRSQEVHGSRFDYSKVVYVSMHSKVLITVPFHGEFLQAPVGHLAGLGCKVCSGKVKYTAETFAARARDVHGDRYFYDQVVYVNNKVPVTIVCPHHGAWQQKPNAHLQGHGCFGCFGSKQHTKETFVAAAREVHGGRYDYGQVEYGNNKTPVLLVCDKHGVFQRTPNAHLRGLGCPDCVEVRPHTTDSFIAGGRRIHGDKYDYSQVSYVSSGRKVDIRCPEHGPFRQVANSHLQGIGCAQCKGVKRHTHESFLLLAREIHGDKYDYSRFNYRGNKNAVIIICPIHGEFSQKPNGHLSGQGCMECSGKRKLTRSEFVERAHHLHGGKYDYSEVFYRNRKELVSIICPDHGTFLQRPDEHLRARGCPVCRESVPEGRIRRLLAAAGIEAVQQWGHPDLRYVLPLRFDFMLPTKSTLIEYDGPHHFAPVSWNFTDQSEADAAFERQKERDTVKNLWAKENGWDLIRISNAATIEEDLIAAGVLHALMTEPTLF